MDQKGETLTRARCDIDGIEACVAMITMVLGDCGS
jgi:hypothetical protein